MLLARQLPSGLSFDSVIRHTAAPPYMKDVRIEEVSPAREARFQLPVQRVSFPRTPQVDLGALGVAIHEVLKDRVVGYTLQANVNGTVAHVGIWNWSRTPADAGSGWKTETRMHVASVSKLLTAIGMVKALTEKGLAVDTPIAPFLPAHWQQGTNIGSISFRHLLTHTAGFRGESSASDYTLMKSRVAAGVAKVGEYDYENMGFGLCRLLIPIVSGRVKRDATWVPVPAVNDQVWDAVAIHHFRGYMQDKVFTPAGVPGVGFAPGNKDALAYRQPHADRKGWNSGDLSTMAGGAGFRLSPAELLRVLDHARRRGTILAKATVASMLDDRLGIDQIKQTPAGKTYNKNGAWGPGSGESEQCVAFFMPGGVELALFVNSPVGAENFSLRNLVNDAYVNALRA